ncbi:MAG: DUF4339 domain-containing protein [Planctomycetia bacterium]
MGIVAFCPRGHRINVKDSFAGRKGLCPTCGAKFQIPAAGSGEPPPAAAGLPTARLLDMAADVVATLPRILPFEAPPPAPEPALEPAFEPPPAPLAPPPPALHPALAERPDLEWCIAFPGGEPTEPLSAESMQAWLESGQVTGTEVVWRSDWPEWLPARDVFPDVIPDAIP